MSVYDFTFIFILLFLFFARNSNLNAFYDCYLNVNASCDLLISLRCYI